MTELWESLVALLPGMIGMSVLSLVSGFCSGSETAMFYLSRDELRAMQVGRPRQRLAAQLVRDPERLLTGILFWNLLTNLTFFAMSVVVTRRLIQGGHTTAAGVFGLLSVGAIIVVGEVLPKSLAVLFPRRLAEWAATPVSLMVRVLDPVMPWMAGLTRGLRRGLYPHLKREPFLDADDLERALETLPQGQSIVPYERAVLHRILDLSEITAEEMMRPRGRYVVWKPPVHRAEVVGKLKQGEYIFIQDGPPETIRGVVPLGALAALPDQNLETVAARVIHVPWCARVADVVQSMQDQLCSVAAVVNEYGETMGVLTEEDILDSIFSREPSRAKRLYKRDAVLPVGDGVWHVEGITTLRHLAHKLGIEFDPDEDDSVTVGGLLQGELERFPREGDECHWHGYRLRVIDAPGRGQLRAEATRTAVAGRPAQAHGSPEGRSGS